MATQETVATTSVAFAAVTFLMWDWLISLGDEVDLIWRSRCGWQRWMYCFLRYFTLVLELVLTGIYQGSNAVGSVSTEGCRTVLLLDFLVLLVLNTGVEIVLSWRVYALYGRSMLVLHVLLALFMTNLIVAFTMVGLVVHRAEIGPSCTFVRTPHILVACWVAPISYETILLTMTVYKCWATQRGSQSVEPILHTLIKDGVWAYIVLFATFIINALAYSVFPVNLANIFYFWAVSGLSFTGSHVILSLRKLATESNGIRSPSTTLLTTDFRFTTHVPFTTADADPQTMGTESLDIEAAQEVIELRTIGESSYH